jgi:hypothetical protein
VSSAFTLRHETVQPAGLRIPLSVGDYRDPKFARPLLTTAHGTQGMITFVMHSNVVSM